MVPLQISVAETKRRLDAGEITLLDCREPAEHAIAAISGAKLIPMNTIPPNLPAIEAMTDAADVVVYCHHGVRSLNVVNWLRQQGIPNVQSMEGGIDAWSVFVDPAVARY